jgi:hypothetical protein
MENGLTNVFSYTKLILKKNIEGFTPAKPISYIPNPTEDDYSTGYIQRNFAQKTNDKDAPIFEINIEDDSTINSFNDYYTTVSIQWRLVGTPQEIMDSNSKSVKAATSTILNLSHYLSNLLQFAKVK